MSIESFLGSNLRFLRAGSAKLVCMQPEFARVPNTVQVGSTAFACSGAIPSRYTSDGEELFPPLHWSAIPDGTKEMVLLVEDADPPLPSPIAHAVVCGLGAGLTGLPEAALPRHKHSEAAHLAPGVVIGKNTFGSEAWLPPRPVAGHGTHAYYFQLFALDTQLSWASAPKRAEVVGAMRGHVLGKGWCVGTYIREG